jgi:hypothetical protein
MRSRSLRRAGAVALVAVFAVLAASCTTSSRPPQAPPPPDDTPVWMLGDSLAWATASRMRPLPYVGAVGASGFTSGSRSLILDNVLPLLYQYPNPTHVLVMGGVNDIKVGITTQDIVDGMQALEAEMTAQGITTVWVAEPAWTLADRLNPVADWINTQPLSIDCRAYAGTSSDGIHPVDYVPMATCIDAALADMGIIWTND